MADFTALKNSIQTYIKQNGNEEITGNILQEVLLSMVQTMGDGAINDLVTALAGEVTARQNADGSLQTNINNEANTRSGADTALGVRIDGVVTSINAINTKLAEGYIYAGIATPSANPDTPTGKVFYIATAAGTYTYFLDSNSNPLVLTLGINILKYNGSAWLLEQVIAIDDYPVYNSGNLVKSGGLHSMIANIDKALSDEIPQPTTLVSGCYLRNTGKLISGGSWSAKYFSATKGDIVHVTASAGGSYGGVGLFTNTPQIGGYADIIYNLDDVCFIVPFDCYILVSTGTPDLGALITNKLVITSANNNVLCGSSPVLTPVQVVENRYIKYTGVWTTLSSQEIKIYSITAGKKYWVHSESNSNYIVAAWYDSLPTDQSTAISLQRFSSIDNIYTAPQGASYLAISGYVGNNTDHLYACSVEYLNVAFMNLKKYVGGKYYNKTCLYIGDSVSTNNNYKWKGYLEENYKLNYVRGISGQLQPANGGITVLPPTTESEELQYKSIWYRCANNRMGIYTFDIISLFGGTNDMTDQNLTLGSLEDVPYVDDATTITSETVTDVRPETLTFAAAFMGCILMLKRDFPNKEILIPTVMYCGSPYGTQIDPVSGLMVSEAMALLQMKIAQKYELKAIPLYWDMRKESTISVFSTDKVHPNMQQALRMQSLFAQTLPLK